MLIAVGSVPVSIGPMIAQSVRTVTSTSPILNDRCAASLRRTGNRRRSASICVDGAASPTSVIAHPWIDQGIDDIHGNVDQHESEAEQQHGALDQRVVAGHDPLHHEPADTRQRKHLLYDD